MEKKNPHIGKKSRLSVMLTRWQVYTLVLPAIVYVFLFNYMPMYGVQIAFRKFSTSKGVLGSPWVGLKYFEKFWSLPIFWTLIRNTLTITVYSLATFPIPIVFALMLNEVRNTRFKKTVQTVSYAPHFISTVVLCSMLTLFLSESSGVFNSIIRVLGGTPKDFLTMPSAFPSIVVWSGIWQELGWSSIIYIAALAGVSPELIEAAKLDGAGRFKVIWHVNIPCILPTIVILLIMRFGSLMSLGFEKIYLLQNSLNMETSRIIATYVYELGLLGGQFSQAAAVGLFNTVVNVALLACVNTIARKLTEISLW